MSKKKKTKTKTRTYKSESTSTRVVFLLDRTGSMASCKAETISGFNGYLDTIKDTPNTTITLVQFDTMGIDTLCEGVRIDKCYRLNHDNYVPRAMTPLYDALGRTINNTKASVNGQKVLFVTLTDGLENASTEWTSEKVKALMKDCEDSLKWTFAYIGVGPEGWSAMKEVSSGLISSSNVMNINKDPASIRKMYRSAGQSTHSYACSVGSDVVTGFWGDKKDEDES